MVVAIIRSVQCRLCHWNIAKYSIIIIQPYNPRIGTPCPKIAQCKFSTLYFVNFIDPLNNICWSKLCQFNILVRLVHVCVSDMGCYWLEYQEQISDILIKIQNLKWKYESVWYTSYVLQVKKSLKCNFANMKKIIINRPCLETVIAV